MGAELKSYDRQENETIKAYTAFCIYRDLGTSRTIEKTAEKYYKPDPSQGKASCRSTSQLRLWSSANNWIDRCKDYDRDIELTQRSIKSEVDRDAYIKDLENYQLQQKAIGTAALNFTARSLQAIDYALRPIHEVIKARGQLTRDQIETLFSSQLAGKNAIAIATAGRELAAKGLVVEEMMEHVQNEIDSRQS
jgi:hypothetical protein